MRYLAAMPEAPANERIIVTGNARTVGASMTIGEVVVAITLPSPAGFASMSETAARAAAVRLAQRALTVAQEELEQEAPAAQG